MTHWIVKTKPGCEFCVKAKELLAEQGIVYQEQKHETMLEIIAFKQAGFKTFPQVFCDGNHIGGYTELKEYFNALEVF